MNRTADRTMRGTAGALLWLTAALLLFCALPAAAAEGPSFRNTILVYCDPDRTWTPGSFNYYLAYIDRNGVPKDWLFDGFLLMAIAAPSRNNFWDGLATPEDWDWWLERLFANNEQLEALDHDAGVLKGSLGDPGPRKIIISVPRPPVRSTHSEQLSVIRNFADRCIEKFAAKNFRNLVLDGFYWFYESVEGKDGELVNALHAHLHDKGLRLYWIPFDNGHTNRKHVKDWQAGTLRLDGLWLQPNFFWAERANHYDEQDLDDTASFARSAGAGVEMEFDHGVYASGWKLGRYSHYLNSAGVYGISGKPTIFYDGYKGYIACGESRNPVERSIYDDLYWYTRGMYLPKNVIYPGNFADMAGDMDFGDKPRIGLWLDKGSWSRPPERRNLDNAEQVFLVEPDPDKDYLIIFRYKSKSICRLEVQTGGRWLALGGLRSDRHTHVGYFKLPKEFIRKDWDPQKPLIVPLRFTGDVTLFEGWARPDDSVFHYLKGREPMQAEIGLDIRSGLLALTNIFDEMTVGVRVANRSGKAASLTMGKGAMGGVERTIRAGTEGKVMWSEALPDKSHEIKFRPGLGVEILEIWAFPPATTFHLRAGSSGDTCETMHMPGLSLVPDGKWKLKGPFGLNYREGTPGAALSIAAPPYAGRWRLTVAVDSEGEGRLDIFEGRVLRRSQHIAKGASQRITVDLKDGDYRVVFSGPVTLYDAWLERRTARGPA